MDAERFVLLALAPPRAEWFDAVAQWSMSASIAAEFVKCVSAEEVGARLASGRRHSALLADVATPALDRDLVDAAATWSTPVIVVGDPGRAGLSPRDLGFAAELPASFSPGQLLDVLAAHCRPVGNAVSLPPAAAMDGDPAPLWLAQLFTVCSPGGTGASTIAMGLAQGLSADARFGRRVLLADLALRAEQAMLHDSAELGPGVQELVDAHRLKRPSPEEVARLTFDVPARGYRLLLGLRYPEAWTALRPRATEAALTGLRHSFQAVVADVDGEVEGEVETGSVDVEDRHRLARTATGNATVTVAVGSPGLKGVSSLAGLIRRLVRSGVPAARILPVLNRAPRHPAARAESTRALTQLLAGSNIELAVAAPVHVPERKIEDALRDGSPLPSPLVDPITKAALALAARTADAAPPLTEPRRVVPGSLGAWSDVDT